MLLLALSSIFGPKIPKALVIDTIEISHDIIQVSMN